MFIQLAPDLNTHNTLDELQERNQCHTADPKTWDTPAYFHTAYVLVFSSGLWIKKNSFKNKSK